MGSRLDSPQYWIRKAESSLAMARARVKGALPEEHCFHAQQAAEKALKAAYVAHRLPFEFTHNLKELADGLEARGVRIPEEVQDAEMLDHVSRHAVEFRYVVEDNVPEAERKAAVKIAELTVRWAKTEIARQSGAAGGRRRRAS